MYKIKKISKHILDEMRYHDEHSEMLIERNKKDLIWQVPEKMIFIDKYLFRNKSWKLLDAGCGSAENIKKNILCRMGNNDLYVGVDISKKLLQKAKQNIPRGVFIQRPMSDLKFPRNCFDYICFFGSLHHDEFPESTIKRVSKFLKLGGFIFLREPDERAFRRGYGASPHEGGLNPTLLEKWLKNCNLEVLEWHFFNTALFHFFRRVLIKLKLSKWEEKVFLWKVKIWIELLLEKIFNRFLISLRGTDMFIVARRKS